MNATTAVGLVAMAGLSWLGAAGVAVTLDSGQEAGRVASEVRQQVEERNAWEYHLPPCQYEDSTSCVWLATERGDSNGESFYADGEGNILPLNEDQALVMMGRQ